MTGEAPVNDFTAFGRAAFVLNIFVGHGLFGVPAAIFCAGFTEKLEARESIQKDVDGGEDVTSFFSTYGPGS